MKVGCCTFRAVIVSALAGCAVEGQPFLPFGIPKPNNSTIEETNKLIQEWVENTKDQKEQCAAYVVKTYVNVFVPLGGLGLVGADTIANQMVILNAAFSTMGFQFTYNPAEINTVFNNYYYPNLGEGSQQEIDMKNSYHRGGPHDLNIYIHNNPVNSETTTTSAGWGILPYTNTGKYDGVVLLTRTLPGGNAIYFNEGDNLVTLVGLWIGLFPTYQGGCTAPGDGVSDTPYEFLDPEEIPPLCPVNRDSCPSLPGLDPIRNYMSFTADSCRNTFTTGQRLRAQAIWEMYRGPFCSPTCCAPPPPPPSIPPPPVPVPVPVRPPTPSPTPAPSCFSGANTVVVEGKGVISMELVQIGDRLKTNTCNDKYSRVFSLAHINNEHEVEYVQIYTEDSIMPLEVTHDHFLHIDDTRVVRARDINVGDTLGEQQRVTFIKTVTRRGLYNPVTESGDILVSGVRASCFPSMLDVDPTIQAYLMHASLSILRLACSLDFTICMNESYTKGGISTYLAGMMELVAKFRERHTIVQHFFVIICSPFLLGLLALEKLCHSPRLLTTLLGAFVLRRKYFVKKSLKAKSMDD